MKKRKKTRNLNLEWIPLKMLLYDQKVFRVISRKKSQHPSTIFYHIVPLKKKKRKLRNYQTLPNRFLHNTPISHNISQESNSSPDLLAPRMKVHSLAAYQKWFPVSPSPRIWVRLRLLVGKACWSFFKVKKVKRPTDDAAVSPRL